MHSTKYRRHSLTLFITTLLSLVSCQRESHTAEERVEEGAKPEFEVLSVKSYHSGTAVRIEMDGDFEGENLRALQYTEDATTGALSSATVKDTERVHIYLRRKGDASTTSISTITWRGRSSNILDKTAFSINLPTGVSIQKGEEWYMAGILGGEIDAATGKVTIGQKLSEGAQPIPEGNVVEMPYYFGWKQVTIKDTNELQLEDASFRPLGSLLRLHFYNNLLEDFDATGLTIKSNALRPSGELDLPPIENATAKPTWTPLSAEDTTPVSWSYKLGGQGEKKLHLPRAQGWSRERTVFVWAMPTTLEAPHTDTRISLEAQASSSPSERLTTETYANPGHRALKSGLTYRLSNTLTSDLMISEVYYQFVPGASNTEEPSKNRNYSIIELYNPTASEINLADYALARTVYYEAQAKHAFFSSGNWPKDNISEASLQKLDAVGQSSTTSDFRRIYGTPSTKLAPGKTLLIGSGGYVAKEHKPSKNIELYNSAVASTPGVANDPTTLKVLEKKYLPRAGMQIDSAFWKGYTEGMVALDGSSSKDRDPNPAAVAGVLQLGNGQGVALVKSSGAGLKVIDITMPMGSGQAVTDYRARMLSSINDTSAEPLTSLNHNLAMSYSLVRVAGISSPSSVYQEAQWTVSSTENDGIKSLGTRNYVAGLSPFAKNYSGYNEHNNPKSLPFWSVAPEFSLTSKGWTTLPERGANVFHSSPSEVVAKYSLINVASGTTTANRTTDNNYPFSYSYDRNYNTGYHSNDNGAGGARLPADMVWHFDRAEYIEHIDFTPYSRGTSLSSFDIYFTYEDGTTEKVYTNDDFGTPETRVRIEWSGINARKVTSVRFHVRATGYTTLGVKEMEFYKITEGFFDPTVFFEDQACTVLKNSVTYQDIMKIENTFFREMIRKIYQGSYKREFRIHRKPMLVNPVTEKNYNKTQYAYSRYNGATGISIQEGEDLIVFVDAPKNQLPQIVIQNLGTHGYGGPTYTLRPGLNKIRAERSGLVYVIHNAPTLTIDRSVYPDITLHFASGRVNGYFDTTNPLHQGRWKELLSKATDTHFDVLGKYAHITFPITAFRQYTDDGTELIAQYDNVVLSEMELMGLVKYNRVFTNRSYFMHDRDGGMWATEYRTGYPVNEPLLKVGGPSGFKIWTWGVAHEQGHLNQTIGLLWGGMIEISNNIHSAYIEESIYGNPSRSIRNDWYTIAWNDLLRGTASLTTKSQASSSLIPLWQLELYFGNVKKLTPRYQADKGGFYPELYERLRNYSTPQPNTATNNGIQQTNFALHASIAAGMDLTDFFERWGFFRLTNNELHLNTYNHQNYLTVTEEMVNDVKGRIKALNLPKPDVAIEYITSLNWQKYLLPMPVVIGTAQRTGRTISMNNWQNVVAWEVVDSSGTLRYTATGRTSNAATTDTFTIDFEWATGMQVRAISATGQRTPVVL